MYFDLHAHIIPYVDDGAKSVKEALEMLDILKDQGVSAVAATPHFYAYREGSFEKYCERIDAAYKELLEHKPGDLPQIIKGCEVHYFKGMSRFDLINQLCIGDSKYILVELPYRTITDKIIDEIINLKLYCGLIPILAHIERYSKIDGFDKVLKIINEGFAIGQVNAYSLLKFSTRRQTLRLLEYGYATIIAGDSHSTKGKPPLIAQALQIAQKRLPEKTYKNILSTSEKILNEVRSEN